MNRPERTVSVADGAPRPRWRGAIHLIAAAVAVPAGLGLFLLGPSWGEESVRVIGLVCIAVYVASVVALYGTSAAYHLISRSERAQHIMRRADHSMIFVQIAGTYTAVCGLAMPADTALRVLIPLWSFCALGVVLKTVAGDKLLRLSNIIYIVLGWVALFALPAILKALSTLELALLIIGGFVYTLGAILFALRVPKLAPTVFGYHEVWHVMTVLAGASHFGLVWMLAGRVNL